MPRNVSMPVVCSNASAGLMLAMALSFSTCRWLMTINSAGAAMSVASTQLSRTLTSAACNQSHSSWLPTVLSYSFADLAALVVANSTQAFLLPGSPDSRTAVTSPHAEKYSASLCMSSSTVSNHCMHNCVPTAAQGTSLAQCQCIMQVTTAACD